jgi:hypothetical protein
MIPITDDIRKAFLKANSDFISQIGASPSDLHVLIFDSQEGGSTVVNKTTRPDYHIEYPLSRFLPVASYLNPHITFVDLSLLGNLTAVPTAPTHG